MSWESDAVPHGPRRYTTINARVGRGADTELQIKRSRFLTRLRRVTSEAEVRAVVEDRRRTHFDARHHCSAFILGPDARTARSSDDGEPAGTAGAPMLHVLQQNHLIDVVAVVTRYFGGIKLGAGGLVRAYSDAVAQAVSAIGTRDVALSALLRVDVPMAEAGAVEAHLRSLILPSGAPVLVDAVEWTNEARINVSVLDGAQDELATALASMSGGTLVAVPTGQRWVDVPA